MIFLNFSPLALLYRLKNVLRGKPTTGHEEENNQSKENKTKKVESTRTIGVDGMLSVVYELSPCHIEEATICRCRCSSESAFAAER